jgi:hypothetical protein
MSSFAGLLRLASVVICVIVIAAFAIFVFDQAKGASAHQQQAVAAGAASNTTGESSSRSTTSPAQESAPHRVLDEVSNGLTSPFSGITAGSNHVWAVHGVNLVLALLIYGFGFGYLARVLRAHL